MDDALPFDPRTIIWFHAVNTVGRWRATLSSIENAIKQQQVARTQHDERLCFGVEIDVRLWQVAKPESETEKCVLVLAHDPLTLSSTVATHGSDGDGQEHHMALSDLMSKLSELNKRATTSVVFILKLDVKEPEALPILLDLLSGVYTSDPTTSRHCFKFSEHLELAPCQVWLNMDVVPLAHTDLVIDGASSPCATHSVAEVALAHFHRAVHCMGVGLSLGWIIDPSFREWCINERREEDVSKRKDLKALRKGNHAMLSFVKRIFEDNTVKRQEGEIVTHHDESLVLITFALNFAIFIGDESALVTLDELIRDTQSVIKDEGRRAVIFPTYWRARCDTISEEDETKLTIEISKFGHTCSVDRE